MVSSPLPRHQSVTLRFAVTHRFATLKIVAIALVIAAAGLGLMGCPGDLDPRLLGGTGGTGPNVCDAATLMRGTKCSISGCHNSTMPSSDLDLFSTGVASRLLGHTPPATSEDCSTNTTPYIVPNSDPVMGLLLDKLKSPAPCGLPMPYPGIDLLPANEIACITEWAQAVAKGEIQ